MAQIHYFARFYRVTALDFIGFGGSSPLKYPFSVADYALWTKEAMALLGVKKPHVIAHSFGCRVTVKLASLENEIFDKILLTGPAGIILNRGAAYRWKVGLYRVMKRIAPHFAEKKFGSKEYRALSPIMKESYKKIVNEDLRDCAKSVQNQVLIVEGREDNVTTLREAQTYLQAFPHGKMCIMQGGHFAFAERPTSFNMIAEEFLYG
jgi:pimeloyl-ACP methyl ester carboxylesterase